MACDRGVIAVGSVGRSLGWLRFLFTIASLVALMIVSLGLEGCSDCGSGSSVEQPKVMSITIDPPTAKTPVGTTKVFAATEIYANGAVVSKTDNPLFLPLEWSTSDKTIATIDATGKAKGLKPGSVKVIATEKVSGVTASAALTVTDATIVTVVVTPATATAPMGTMQPFVATGTFTDSTTHHVTAIVSWTSSDAAIATIATDGKASALPAGKI